MRNESEREEFTPSFDVPENPPHVILKFRQRAEIDAEIGSDATPEEQLRKKLLGLDGPQSVGAVGRGSRTTVGMKGMGGIGKSCALRGLAVDGEVRKKFCDGIYWLILGQDATKTRSSGTAGAYHDGKRGREA